jgi:hypothetical protein
MPDLTISGTITRTELSLAALDLNTGGYKIIEWGPGAVEHEKMTVASAYIDGSFLMNSKKMQVESALGIRVTGSTQVDCWNKMGALLRAFEQFEYTLSIVMDGTTFTYTCDPADYAVGDGGLIQKFHLMAYKQEVKFLIPRRPTPTSGPV